MKKSVYIIAILVLAGAVNAQKIKEADVPKPVMDAFKNKYATGAKEWEKEKDGTFEAEFKLNGKETSASFRSDGTFVESEEEIKLDELPEVIKDNVSKNYSDFKIEEASKISTAEGKTMYEVEIKKGKEEYDVIYDSAGNFIKKEAEDHEEKNDDHH
jgi:uncharacterized membrane protein YkoI